jgi:hypothetical protein
MIRRVRSSKCGHAARNFRLNNSDGVLMNTEHTAAISICNLYLFPPPKIATTLPDGRVVEAVADYAFRNGDQIVFGEVKFGLHARFTVNQKLVYAAIAQGKVSILSARAASALNVAVGKPLSGGAARLTVHALQGSRAASQFGRLFGRTAGATLRVLASAPLAGVMLFLETSGMSNYQALLDECPECTPAATATVH